MSFKVEMIPLGQAETSVEAHDRRHRELVADALDYMAGVLRAAPGMPVADAARVAAAYMRGTPV